MTDTLVRRPKRLIIIAVLFCIIGVIALYDFLLPLIYFQQISVNLAWLLVPVGIGLFLGKESALMWAKIWCIIGYILLASIVTLFFMYSGMLKVDLYGKSHYGEDNLLIACLLCLAYLAAVALIHFQLYHPRVTAFFQAKLNPHTRARLERLSKRSTK
ncbi:hypothetical protein [Glaciecola petra]|uniref:Uncharacterized protein n=1 Tax=Glaciecola petra TaxID=3075602 RepID=A0ABU2ZSB0_9ALTE|nr:hypothetical protein [Aestuariibacter sp. P117]MDT0595296.1 hypothetical protein [Aestuariibacter sp. P117]